jgi:hypothetical protein
MSHHNLSNIFQFSLLNKKSLVIKIVCVPVEIRSYNHLARSEYKHARFSQHGLETFLEAFLLGAELLTHFYRVIDTLLHVHCGFILRVFSCVNWLCKK